MEGERYAASLRGFRPERAFAGAPGAGSAIALALDGARGELSIAADGCVRLRIGRDELPALPEAASLRSAWRPVGAGLRESPTGGFALGLPGLHMQVEVEAKPFGLRVVDRRSAAIAELGGLRCSPDSAVAVALTLGPGDSVHGLAGAVPALDLRGRALRLCLGDTRRRRSGTEARFAVPFLLVHRTDPTGAGSCGVLVDSFGACHFDVGAARAGALEIHTEGGGLDLLLVPGPRPRDVLRRLSGRVGRPPLPPRWALGHHVVLRARSARAVRRALARHQHAEPRPAALHLELRSGAAFAWPARRFPDARGLLRELAEQGVRTVIRIPPGIAVNPADPVYRDGLARNVFLQHSDGRQYAARAARSRAALPDWNRAEVRRWWAEQHAPLLEAGAAGFWNDRNAAPVRARDARELVSSDPGERLARVPFESVRHLSAQQQCRATREALEARDPARRGFVLSAGGGTGIASHAAASMASGPARWSELAATLPRLLSLSLCGAALCGADIGGDAGRCAPELFARWMQIGALQPFARSRAPIPRLPRRVVPIVRDALALRARLLPYLESLLRSAERDGAPVWRALLFEFPGDPEAPAIDDQLMLGPALMVAPVLGAGVRERSVYLPAGEWLAWHDDALYRGPRRVRVAAPLARLPLFVCAGTVLPTAAPRAPGGPGEAMPDAILLEVFPGADRRFEWVEDDGATTRYRDGEVARTAVRLWSRAGGRLRLELGRREGPFEIAPRLLRIRIHACPRADAVLLDGAPLREGDATPGWRIEDGRVLVPLPDDGRGAAVEVVPAP